MRWFKFYGQDFLTDSKLMDFNPIEKLMWVYVLCIANAEDKNGIIGNLTEEKLFRYANLDEEDRELARGILQKLCDNKMITKSAKNDNEVSVINWKKLQNTSLSGYERVKKYRAKKERQNKQIKNVDDNANDNVHDNDNDNARIDKTRIDINTYTASNESTPSVKGAQWARPTEEKRTSVQRLVYHLEDTLHTRITNWGKQGQAVRTMLSAGYSEDQIKKAITYMATRDEFYRDKGFDLMTVSNHIPRLKAMDEKRRVHAN
jgi:hypothetical protein